MASTEDLGSIIGAGASRRRWRWVAAGVAVAVVVAGVAYRVVRGGESAPAPVLQPVTVSKGTLATIAALTGTSAVSRSTDLSFGTAGIVAAVSVKPGDAVKQGQVLARLDDTDAQRSLLTAQANLEQAQLRLASLQQSPLATDLAAAQQATASARSQLTTAEQNLRKLTSPSQTDIAAARQAVVAAGSQLGTAELALQKLRTPPTAADVAAADAALAQAESSVTSAQNLVQTTLGSLHSAFGTYCLSSTPNLLPQICFASVAYPLGASLIADLNASIAPSLSPFATAVTRATALLSANASYANALAGDASAKASLKSAQQKRAALDAGATLEQLWQARAAVTAAEQSLLVARQREQMLLRPTADDLVTARASVDSARAALVSAEAKEAQVAGGTDAITVAQQQVAVRQAEIQVAAAQAALDNLALRAPYDGTVGRVGLNAGDRVAGTLAALTVLDPQAVVVNLTVSETDLPRLKAGLLGIASFDALPGQPLVVRVFSISTVPTVSQGVVTYPVQAEVLRGARLAELAGQLQSLAAAFGGGLRGALAGGGLGPGGLGATTGAGA
ncbi:MAG: HlyD family efflux transporter periplasmic adaptor subunit, partial [Chloroflexi bacterium]|nr:HlyD family efflux transporter periplasmic adaptor subunit [Chloroflexota bacterium]